MVKNLATLERELSGRLEEARRSAERSIGRAQEEAQRIMAEAEAQVRQMADASANLIAGQEAGRIREKAEPRMDRAVDFILSRVVP